MLIKYLRYSFRLLKILNGFRYDLFRFLRYSGALKSEHSSKNRQYHLRLRYHALEKSLSVRNRDASKGYRYLYGIVNLLKNGDPYEEKTFTEEVSASAAHSFVRSANSTVLQKLQKDGLSEVLSNMEDNETGGVMDLSTEDIHVGKLNNPDDFFFTRYSVREYSSEGVGTNVIEHILRIAQKTPSVCNRQPWGTFYFSNNNEIKEILELQDGNKTFREGVKNLFVVYSDLNGFLTSNERYQAWIDGGMYSMTLLYAIHALGLCGCPLNWSVEPAQDMKLKRLLNLSHSQQVVMMISFGYPQESSKVCKSTRENIN